MRAARRRRGRGRAAAALVAALVAALITALLTAAPLALAARHGPERGRGPHAERPDHARVCIGGPQQLAHLLEKHVRLGRGARGGRGVGRGVGGVRRCEAVQGGARRCEAV